MMSLKKPWTFLSMAIGASSPLFSGCSASADASTPRSSTATETAALDAPNGSIDVRSREPSAFGDPEVEAIPVMDDALVNEVAPLSLSTAGSAVPEGTAYRVALVWGHLPLARDKEAGDVASAPAQWAGSIQVDSGAIGLIRTIAFGRGDRLDPMSSTQAVSFRSETGGFVAGLLLRVIIPRGDDSTLHFATSLLSADIELATLTERAGGIVRAAGGSAGVGWFGFREDGCERGFVLGRWVKDHPGLGRSLATVSDASGARIGYVRGAWGYTPTRAGEVWFDKYIDLAGNAKGLAFGWYGDGFYRGLWAASDEHDESALRVGTTEGLYSDGVEAGDGSGVWLGRWSAPCLP